LFDIIFKEQFGVRNVTEADEEEGKENIEIEFVPLTQDELSYKRELLLTYKKMYANK
jgi:hypothetical protein